ncbi:MAG: glycosyltransferase family 4 protein [Hyphomicrobiaceae bacterium]
MNQARATISTPTDVRKSVAILVNNSCTYDSRVIKGAEALAQRGFRVCVFAVKANNLPDIEQISGVVYRRLPRQIKELRNVASKSAADANAAVPSYSSIGRLRRYASDLNRDLIDTSRLVAAFLLRDRWIAFEQGRLKLKHRVRGALNSSLKEFAAGSRRLASRINAKMRIGGATPKEHVMNAMQGIGNKRASPEESDSALRLVNAVVRRYQNAVEAFQPDIIHCHDADCIASAAQLSSALGCPFIYDVHELCAHRWDRSDPEFRDSITAIESQHIHDAGGIVTVSEELADELRASYGRQALVIYNSPRFDSNARFDRDLRSDLKLGEEIPLAVYTGVLAVTRGLERFIKAMQSETKVHFAMVGKQTPELIEHFTELSKDLGVADRVHFVAAVPFDAVSTYISTASFGVIPAVARTRNQKVGLPNKLFEMMFAGLPVLVGDIPQRRRVLQQYGEGVFFPDEEDVDLAPYIAKISAMSGHPDFRKNCRRKGESAAMRVGWLSQMERMFELYDEILDRGDAQSARCRHGRAADGPRSQYHASP